MSARKKQSKFECWSIRKHFFKKLNRFFALWQEKKNIFEQDASLAMVSNGRRNHNSTSFSPPLRTTHYYYQAADVTTKE